MKTKKAIKPMLTMDELNQIDSAANRTFDYIAGDLMTLIQECEGRDYMKQDEVIEMVLDAGRINTIGGLSLALDDKLNKLPYTYRENLLKKIFPAKRYS